MREMTNALMGLTWRWPLRGAQRTAKLFSRSLTSALGGPCTPAGSFASTLEEQVENLFRATQQAADSVQRQSVEFAFDAVTLKPVRESLQQNFPFLGPVPELGSQRQPEIDYLRAINDEAPAEVSLINLVLTTLYIGVNRSAEGIEAFEGWLKKYANELEPWQRGVYLSGLALMKASQAHVTPIWHAARLVELIRGALADAEEAKRVTAHLPNFDQQMAKLIARWTSGLLNAQLPAPFGDKQEAFADLDFVNDTITADVRREAQAFMFLRETYFALANLYCGDGDPAKAEKFLELSTYPSLKKKVDIILATLFSADDLGLRDGIKHVSVHGDGKVFTVSGYDMSEYNFVISENGEELIAIDSGSQVFLAEPAWEAFVSFLEAHHIERPPLTTVIFTHAHWDHIGGHPVYRRLNPDVKFISRYNFFVEQKEAVEVPPPYQWFLGRHFRLDTVEEFEPDTVVDDENAGLTIGGTKIEFHLMPGGGGETPDGMFIFLPELKVLFGGDFIVPWVGSPYNAEGDMDSMINSMKYISALEPEIILYGHEAVTLFYSRWQVLDQFWPHLRWLTDKVIELIHVGKTRVEILNMGLVPPGILAPDQAQVQLPYLLMRESVINRVYNQSTGYWGPKLEDVDYLSNADFGSLLRRYLEQSPDEVATAIFKMVRNGDLELAGKAADWALTQYPGNEQLERSRFTAYAMLKQKWQVANVFKFLMYSEHIGDPTHQTQPEQRRRPGLEGDFSPASLRGRYDFSLVVGPLRYGSIGEVSFDGAGNFAGTQRLNVGTGTFFDTTLVGTYDVLGQGTGEGRGVLTLPDSRTWSFHFDFVTFEAERAGTHPVIIEIQGTGREPAVDFATGEPLDPPQLAQVEARIIPESAN